MTIFKWLTIKQIFYASIRYLIPNLTKIIYTGRISIRDFYINFWTMMIAAGRQEFINMFFIVETRRSRNRTVATVLADDMYSWVISPVDFHRATCMLDHAKIPLNK